MIKNNRNYTGVRFLVVFLVMFPPFFLRTAPASDWPGFRGDFARSGYTGDSLPDNLSLQWIHRPTHSPCPAWSGRDTRMPFDLAYEPVAVKGMVIFGSSADFCIYALDATTGEIKWTFFTEAPIRFAPAVWKNRIFTVSDDGFLYCLSLDEGKLLWKFRGGPTDELILGNDRVISRWPARGAPVVKGGVVFFGSGIWPSEGIFLHALEAETGNLIWTNDSSGELVMEQPHPGNLARSGVSIQGYLTICGDLLLVPTGRATPASFDLETGAFRWFHLMDQGAGWGARKGAGPFITVADGRFFVENDVFRASDGAFLARGIRERTMAVTPESIVYATDRAIHIMNRSRLLIEKEVPDRKGKMVRKTVLAPPSKTIPLPAPPGPALIASGETIILGTSENHILALSLEDGKILLDQKLDGAVHGLAASGGRLFASTDKGAIYCFSGKGERNQIAEPHPHKVSPPGDVYNNEAERILREIERKKGYLVDLGSGDGKLATAILERTDFYGVLVEQDPRKVEAIRRSLASSGLLGVRAAVLERDPARTNLPDQFANLVISGRISTDDLIDSTPERSKADQEIIRTLESETSRILRPYGGVAVLGGFKENKITRRGPLEGAGTWTHQYANPASTLCSEDRWVKGPLAVSWFTDFNFTMPSRHGRGPAPLFSDGILAIEGLDALLAVDAFNGTRLWEYPLPGILEPYNGEQLFGTAGTNSNMCLGAGSVFLRRNGSCLRLDLETGKKSCEYKMPGKPGSWGFIAFDRGTLFGSRANQDHVVRSLFGSNNQDMSRLLSESTALFALDAETGEKKWSYKATCSIRHNAIVIGGGRVFLIDHPLRNEDLPDVKKRRGEKPPDQKDDAILLCLDEETGREIWRETGDIYGTTLALSVKHGILVMGYQYAQRTFQLPSEKGDRLTGFRTSDGKRLWDARGKYVSRPIINDRTVYTQPNAWDLVTGEKREDFLLDDRQPGGCGPMSGCSNLLLYRSGTLGYTDLIHDHGTENYGGIRPGCWINAITAGGMVLMPDATDQCTCSYLIKSSIALRTGGVRPPRIIPPGGSFRDPVKLNLVVDEKDAAIHYTLDGSPPGVDSPEYHDPIVISRGGIVKVRSFRGNRPSQERTAEFFIDPSVIPLEGDSWQVHDTPGATPAESRWRLRSGAMVEESNHFKGNSKSSDPALERTGTFRIYTPDGDFKDGELALEIASSDNDTLGVAFRLQDSDHYYLFAMDRQRGFHVLALKNGASYRALASNSKGYEKKRWYKLKIVMKGHSIQVFLDGKKDLEAVDESLDRGTFALYAWGCAGAKFRNVQWKPHFRKIFNIED